MVVPIRSINVTMAPFNDDKPIKPLVSAVRDLSRVFLQDMFVGFSSSTGLIKTEHVVPGWSFRLKGKAPQLALHRLPEFREWQPRTSGSISPFTSVFIPVSVVPLIVFIFSLIFLVRFILRRRRKFSEKLEDWETESGRTGSSSKTCTMPPEDSVTFSDPAGLEAFTKVS